MEGSLYALGGFDTTKAYDLIQKLSLDELIWELIEMRLPNVVRAVCCFKLTDTEVYLVLNRTLYSLTPLEVRPLKALSINMQSWYGASNYSRDTLYSSNAMGAARSLAIALTQE
jgi:hypothetical protein